MTTNPRRHEPVSVPGTLLLLFLVFPPSAASAKQAVDADRDRTTGEAYVDRALSAYDSPDSPGLVVAVVRRGELLFARGYGMADLESGAPITPSTPFHVASVSKQFTAFGILLLVERGELALDDDVRRYLPELHDFGHAITLDHLMHHTSGLRDQWSLFALAGGRLDDVITQGDLLRLIYRQRELNFEPGVRFSYSNSGYTLLAEVIERVTGESFAEWMDREVFEPLEMQDTQVYDDHQRIVPGRAESYSDGPHGLRNEVLSFANYGATSVFTTANDLAKWLDNFRTGAVGGENVVREMTRLGKLGDGSPMHYAAGLFIDEWRGLRRIRHSGSDAGYLSRVVYLPELEAGVIVLSNYASTNVLTATTAAVDAFLDADIIAAGGESAVEARVARGPASSAAPAGAAAHAPARYLDAEFAMEYVGRYVSDELDTAWEATYDDERLSLEHRRLGPIPLRPVGTDRFAGEEWFLGHVRFARDARGEVREMFVTDGRVFDVRFRRQ